MFLIVRRYNESAISWSLSDHILFFIRLPLDISTRLLMAVAAGTVSVAQAQQVAPVSGVRPEQLAIVVNDAEPNSIEIGEYYRQAHAIAPGNIIHVDLPDRPRKLTAEQFSRLKERIDAQLKPEIQAVLMLWSAPYAVECNSITAAYTLGFDASQCIKTCDPGKPGIYFNSSVQQPMTEMGIRLSMLLPVDSVAGAKAVIDRGAVSSFARPVASAYYLTTSDQARNSRAPYFPAAGLVPQRKLTIRHLRADSLEGARDIMVYQTGVARVAKLDTLKFLPGALADHLTSFGGDLQGSGQMNSQRWLDAGATASYGTVSEPCNYWQKFPNPGVLLHRYLSGMTALEAYWGSVAWPAQGLFIGDPLAAPYAAYRR